MTHKDIQGQPLAKPQSCLPISCPLADFLVSFPSKDQRPIPSKDLCFGAFDFIPSSPSRKVSGYSWAHFSHHTQACAKISPVLPFCTFIFQNSLPSLYVIILHTYFYCLYFSSDSSPRGQGIFVYWSIFNIENSALPSMKAQWDKGFRVALSKHWTCLQCESTALGTLHEQAVPSTLKRCVTHSWHTGGNEMIWAQRKDTSQHGSVLQGFQERKSQASIERKTISLKSPFLYS